MSFQLTATPESEAGIYKIPLHMKYFDEFGIPYENQNVIAVKIGSVPHIEISQDNSLLLLNQKGTPAGKPESVSTFQPYSLQENRSASKYLLPDCRPR
mgnify:CR=1 FL=1